MSAILLVDIVLLVLLAEALGLAVLMRRSPAAERVGMFTSLAAGAALAMALRLAITGAGPALLAICLGLAFAVHLADFYLRFFRSR